jgi:hypothetical protein
VPAIERKAARRWSICRSSGNLALDAVEDDLKSCTDVQARGGNGRTLPWNPAEVPEPPKSQIYVRIVSEQIAKRYDLPHFVACCFYEYLVHESRAELSA